MRQRREDKGQGLLYDGAPPPREVTISDQERDSQRERMSERRKAGRLLELTDVADLERRERCRTSLLQFCLEYFPVLFYLGFGAMHLEIIHQFQRAIIHGGKISLVAPRGFGKTTLCRVAIVWALVYGYRKYIVLLCSEASLANDRLDEIKDYFEDEDGLLAKDFPELCIPAIGLEGSPQRAAKQLVTWAAVGDQPERIRRTNMAWGIRDVRFPEVPAPAGVRGPHGEELAPGAPAPGSGSLIVARGLEGSIRGLVRGKLRPDLCMCDDPQTDDSARSEIMTASRAAYLRKTIEGMVGPGQSLTILAIWTIIEAGDLADQYSSKQQPDYFSMRFKALPEEPANTYLVEEYIARVLGALEREDYDARAAHAWYLLNQEQIEAGARAGWDEAFDRRDVGDESITAAFAAAGDRKAS